MSLETNEPETKKVKCRDYYLDDWNEKWEKHEIGFHESKVHELLVKYSDKFFNGRDEIKIFVPLCGKSVDMKWLYDKGHTVIGVEFVEKAIREFFDEQGLEFIEEKNERVKGAVFKSKDEKIRIYQCDIFSFNKEMEEDIGAIWDRASFVAINREDRTKYVKLMKSLMTDETVYFLATLDFDETIHPGPPQFVSEEVIQESYGKEYEVKRLAYRDVLEDKHRAWGLSSFNERLDCISKK
ncbi:hypothetical protein LOTGIDRAFT_166471 [Lottia gigantea]|uniref:thiopurine S-methyltransferase n=1 Tax=Lottia gigantea TaxID=225164 RepID=V3ZY70_LOTGI|nr:hypothetical protein LOTGIDRAFT_166471 [Lottia gigantea]ESO87590.1 hypothetical protein LOTGIDRAFT_166471 [Lottia gigantea]